MIPYVVIGIVTIIDLAGWGVSGAIWGFVESRKT
jgi:hypothetical protein